ncbi:MAG: Ig-like domain-containing protein [Planctomycetota bacterium]|jgi:hypothetical protein
MKIATTILALITLLFLTSCHPYTQPKELFTVSPSSPAAYIEVSPWEVQVGNGDIKYVYVRILNQKRNPISNRIVHAYIEEPFVATINDTAVTNANGLAVFTVTGLGFPDKSTIRFTSDGKSYSLDVWESWYKSFSGDGY